MNNDVTEQEISEEILNVFQTKVRTNTNCVRIVISREELPFVPPHSYDIRRYINDDILNAAKLNRFVFYRNLSNEDVLVFDMK